MITADDFLLDGDTAWWVTEQRNKYTHVEGERVLEGVLLRMLDRPCDTCAGLAKRFIDDHGNVWGNIMAQNLDLHESIPCPDCVDGRRTFGIEVEGMVTFGEPPNRHGAGWGTRSLRVSVVPGMVLPIVTSERYRNDMGLRGPFVIAYSDGTTSVYLSTSDIRVTPLPPGARPGRYAAQLRIARRRNQTEQANT